MRIRMSSRHNPTSKMRTVGPITRRSIKIIRNNIAMEKYQTIIQSSIYINERETKQDKDIHSFVSLVSAPMTQSHNIKLGICMEHFFSDVVVRFAEGWTSIRKKNKKGVKETDHLYKNDTLMRIVYAEQKNNINLDTEKSRGTAEKIAPILEELRREYPDYTVEGYIFAARYLHSSEDIARAIISTKYKKHSVIGVNEFLSLFGLENILDYDTYKQLILEICKRKFTLSSS